MSKIHDPDYSNNPAAFWDTVASEYAHLELGAAFTCEDLWDGWKQAFLGRYDWKGKTVLDVGCGGGWLGRLLYDEYEIRQYVGVDISRRSIDFARRNVPEGIIVGPLDRERLDHFPDIAVALNVVHHVPSPIGVWDLMSELETALEAVVLTIRVDGSPTHWQPDNPGNAFWTEPQYVRGMIMPDFELDWKSDVEPAPAHRQYLGFRNIASA